MLDHIQCPLPLFSRRPELGDAQLQVERLVQGVHSDGLWVEVAAASGEILSWYSGKNLGEDKGCVVTL